MGKKKKYKIHWNRVLFTTLIPVVCLFLLYFGLFSETTEKKLIKIGYNKEISKIILNKIDQNDINNILNKDYLPYLSSLLNDTNYNRDNFNKYIEYITTINGNYDIKSVVYLVNNNIEYPYSDKLVNIINNKYFISNRLNRYMNYKSDDVDTIITNVNSNLDYDFYTNISKTDVDKGLLMIVNKYYQLEKDYYYGELVTMDKAYDNKNGSKLNKIAYEAFKKLVDDGEKAGYHIRNNSAYRSYSTQSGLYNNYKNSNGLAWADKWSARAGHSEHQTGLALDVGVKNEYSLGKFESSPEFTWMKDNAHLYGFILRYPKGKEYITGYGYEPWHYRYVGVDVATYIYENDITYEEYYAYFVAKN